MARSSEVIVAFNRGLLSDLGAARFLDIERLRMAASTMVNWQPRVLGSMMFRPGGEYIGATKSNNQPRAIPFIFARDDYARIEFTNDVMRVWVDDALVTREAVSAAVTNGNFTSNVTGWTDSDQTGGVSSWVTGGYLQLLGDGEDEARRDQQVAVTETGTEHALRIVIQRGPVGLRVGSSQGAEDYIAETQLGTGVHSLAFTPTGAFHIRLFSALDYPVLVDSVNVESAGAMEITSPYQTADLRNIRHDQSADVVYLACDGYQQRKIERRSETSWSLVLYEPETGPFRIQNTSETTLSFNGTSGSVTMTASRSLFKSGHLGAIFRVASVGQTVTATASAQNTFTDPIRVSGSGENRRFAFVISGAFTATVTIQYSVGEPGSWVDLAPDYSAPDSGSILDGLDGQIIYYRIGIKSGDYTTGDADLSLIYAFGSIEGIVRITLVASDVVATAVVLQTLGSTAASSDWWEGVWSGYRGYPTAVALYEGRLWWAGRDRIIGSESDQFEGFDDNVEGDAGPIIRSIGQGPVESIHWLMPLARLMLGTALSSANVQPVRIDGNTVLSARSTSFDEPLTPTNFNLKSNSAKGVFVDRSTQRVFEMLYDIQVNDYQPDELTLLVPDLNSAGIVHMAIQMKPDVRLHCVRSDGTVGSLVYDRVENVICWLEHTTADDSTGAGEIEDVVVLPGDDEDQVYLAVKRTIDGNTVRYWEKLAKESQCTGFPGARHADAHYIYSGAATTSISGLDHLEGETVVVWGWNTSSPFTNDDGDAVGKDFGTFVVSAGAISGLSDAVTDACIGLSYVGQFRSVKLATICQNKKIPEIGLLLKNTHYQGVRYGPTLVNADMFDLSKKESGRSAGENHVWSDRETRMEPFGGSWETDARICLRAASPRPATVLAARMTLEG